MFYGRDMAAQYCIDSLDPYAEREVLVTYETDRAAIAIKSVVDGGGHEILPELSAECLRILRLEIVVHPSR